MEALKFISKLFFIFSVVAFMIMPAVAFAATSASVTYQVNNQFYEGYYISPSYQAPFVLLIHDRDGLTDYKVKRANMPLPFLVETVIRELPTKNPGSALWNSLRIR